MDPMGKKGFHVPTNKKCFPNHPRTSSKNKNPPYSPEHLTYPGKKKKQSSWKMFPKKSCWQMVPSLGKKILHFLVKVKGFGTFAVH